MPRRKLTVKGCPKNAAEAKPVKIVATVDEYFFKMVSAVLLVNHSEVRGKRTVDQKDKGLKKYSW